MLNLIDRIMLTEAYLPTSELVKYYGEMDESSPDDSSERSTVSHMPINFGLVSDLKLPESFTAEKVRETPVSIIRILIYLVIFKGKIRNQKLH